MTTIALALTILQGVPGDTILTQREASALLAAVVDHVVPADGTPGGRDVGERPLLLDTDRIAHAFTELAPAFAESQPQLARPHRPGSYEDFATCVPHSPANPGGCRLLDDGIHVSISEARSGEAQDQYALTVRVMWNAVGHGDSRPDAPRMPRMVQGYEGEALFTRVEAGWEFIRWHGVIRVFN